MTGFQTCALLISDIYFAERGFVGVGECGNRIWAGRPAILGGAGKREGVGRKISKQYGRKKERSGTKEEREDGYIVAGS